MSKGFVHKGLIIIVSVILVVALEGCGGKADNSIVDKAAAVTANQSQTEAAVKSDPKPADVNLTGEVIIDGSSTLYPISSAVADSFMKKYTNVQITVGETGSSSGLKMLTVGQANIAGSSRIITDEEKALLKDKKLDEIEMPIAYDGIAVIVNKQNDWAKDITTAELKQIWSPDSTVKKWSEVRKGWPDKDIAFFGLGTGSGSYDFFTDQINGTLGQIRADFAASDDEAAVIAGVSGGDNAIGFIEYGYYKDNSDKLNALAIKADESAPAVAINPDSVKNGSYKPLSRQIYLYSLKSELAKAATKAFIEYYNSTDGQNLIEASKFIALPSDLYQKNLDMLK